MDGLNHLTACVILYRHQKFESREQSHRDELAAKEKAHEYRVKGIITEHQDEIQAAEAHRLILVRRIEELKSSKSTMESDLEAKQTTVQRLVAVSQNLQQDNDKLKEQWNRLSIEPIETHLSAFNDQIAATLAARAERNSIHQKMEATLNANRILATDLAGAQNQALFFGRRMAELNHALEQTPNEVANMSGVIEQKDKMFSVLEMRAGECFTALAKSEEQRSQEKKIACREIASLKARLEQMEITIARLGASKHIFKSQCEAVLWMLQKQIRGVDLIKAMNEYLKIAIQDNSVLEDEIKRRDKELDTKDFKITSLEIAMREVERSLNAEEHSCDELRLALRAEDIKLGVLQMDLDSIEAEHQTVLDEKQRRLVDAEEAYNATLDLMEEGRDERERLLIEAKDNKIAALEHDCRDLVRRRQYLESCLQIDKAVSAQNAKAASLAQKRTAGNQGQVESCPGGIREAAGGTRGMAWDRGVDECCRYPCDEKKSWMKPNQGSECWRKVENMPRIALQSHVAQMR